MWCYFGVILDLGSENLGFWVKSHGYGNLRINAEKFHRMPKGTGSPRLETGSHQLKLGNERQKVQGTRFLLYGNRFPSVKMGKIDKQMVFGNGFPNLGTRFPYFCIADRDLGEPVPLSWNPVHSVLKREKWETESWVPLFWNPGSSSTEVVVLTYDNCILLWSVIVVNTLRLIMDAIVVLI